MSLDSDCRVGTQTSGRRNRSSKVLGLWFGLLCKDICIYIYRAYIGILPKYWIVKWNRETARWDRYCQKPKDTMVIWVFCRDSKDKGPAVPRFDTGIGLTPIWL